MVRPTGEIYIHRQKQRFAVCVKRFWLGAYDTLAEAIEVRDRYLAKIVVVGGVA